MMFKKNFKMIFFVFICSVVSNSLLSQNEEKKYTIMLNSNIFLGNKKNISFVFEKEYTLIAKENQNHNIILKNIKLAFVMECELIVEVLEINEEEKSSKIQLIFSKAVRKKDGDEKSMYFSLNRPYTIIYKNGVKAIYFNNQKVENSSVLEILELMKLDCFPNEKILLKDCKVGDTKPLNEELINSYFFLEKSILKNESSAILSSLNYDDSNKVNFAKILLNKNTKVKSSNLALNDENLVDEETLKLKNELTVCLSSNLLQQSTLSIDNTRNIVGVIPEISATKVVKCQIVDKININLKVLDDLK